MASFLGPLGRQGPLGHVRPAARRGLEACPFSAKPSAQGQARRGRAAGFRCAGYHKGSKNHREPKANLPRLRTQSLLGCLSGTSRTCRGCRGSVPLPGFKGRRPLPLPSPFPVFPFPFVSFVSVVISLPPPCFSMCPLCSL